MNRRQLVGLMASVGASLAVAVVTCLLGNPSSAAPCAPTTGPGYDAAQGATGLAAGEPTTTTLFLPLVCRAKPINSWSAQYFGNSSLSGDPVRTANEPAVDYEWDNGGPPGLPVDRFSARWTGEWAFEEGEYTFFIYADDGVSFWLDNTPVVDQWVVGEGEHLATATFSESGVHQLKLEYFEQTGNAAVRLHWRRTDLFPAWEAKYYANAWLDPPRSLQGIDSAIQFDWEFGAPDELPVDAFSVAWRASPIFPAGTQEIFVYADEGYQLLIDGSVVQEGGWDKPSGGAEDDYYTLDTVASQTVQIGYHAHDRGGPAEARLWIVHADQPNWTAEFYANKDLTGLPAKIRSVAAVFFDWGLEKPTSGIPSDGFSVRWTAQRYFHAGAYRFGIFADDGVRLWMDGQLIVDAWRNGRAEHHPPVRYIPTGLHDIVLEYYENVGEAEIRLWWE